MFELRIQTSPHTDVDSRPFLSVKGRGNAQLTSDGRHCPGLIRFPVL